MPEIRTFWMDTFDSQDAEHPDTVEVVLKEDHDAALRELLQKVRGALEGKKPYREWMWRSDIRTVLDRIEAEEVEK